MNYYCSKSFYSHRLDHFPVNLGNNVVIDLPAPQKINYFWNFGSLLGLYLLIQTMSGLFLSMHYVSLSSYSFDSVNLLVRDVYGGWFIRLVHIVGASGFFLFLMLHLGRGLYYKSFKLWNTWLIGVLIFVLSMAMAFLGYVLPWGQMSYWGATVMTKFLSVMPYMGSQAVIWVWGGFSVDYPTLTRFFSLHFLLPFIVWALVGLHMAFLHTTGSKNPLGISSEGDKISFFPYFLVKDTLGFLLSFFFVILLFFVFPEYFLESENFIQAKSLVTPAHIQPEWYFLPAYAVLRAIPNKLGGVLALVLFILVYFMFIFFSSKLFVSVNNSLIQEFFWWFWVTNLMFLTWVGAQPVEDPYVSCCQMGGVIYFMFFFLWNYS